MILTEKPRPLAPKGMHTAILYQIIDLGTQTTTSEKYGTKSARQVRLNWELPEEKMEDGKPFSIGMTYSIPQFLNSDKAKFSQHMKGWLGEDIKSGFNVADLLGDACNLNVSHDTSPKTGKVYANIASITPLKKGEKAPLPHNTLSMFDFDDFRQEAFDALGEYWQNVIKLSPEYDQLMNPPKATPAPKAAGHPYAPDADMPVDSIPF
jgi:hypothetical protein